MVLKVRSLMMSALQIKIGINLSVLCLVLGLSIHSLATTVIDLSDPSSTEALSEFISDTNLSQDSTPPDERSRCAKPLECRRLTTEDFLGRHILLVPEGLRYPDQFNKKRTASESGYYVGLNKIFDTFIPLNGVATSPDDNFYVCAPGENKKPKEQLLPGSLPRARVVPKSAHKRCPSMWVPASLKSGIEKGEAWQKSIWRVDPFGYASTWANLLGFWGGRSSCFTCTNQPYITTSVGSSNSPGGDSDGDGDSDRPAPIPIPGLMPWTWGEFFNDKNKSK